MTYDSGSPFLWHAEYAMDFKVQLNLFNSVVFTRKDRPQHMVRRWVVHDDLLELNSGLIDIEKFFFFGWVHNLNR